MRQNNAVPFNRNSAERAPNPNSGRDDGLSLGSKDNSHRATRDVDPNALITSRIKATTTWQQAYAVFVQNSHLFNHINTCAMITHLSKLPGPAPAPPARHDVNRMGTTGDMQNSTYNSNPGSSAASPGRASSSSNSSSSSRASWQEQLWQRPQQQQ